MKITFIYNADSGRINTWLDIGHKLLSPDTYSCNLCSLTHGVLTEREEWKKFREQSAIELEFLHKDEFEKKYHDTAKFSYPVILRSEVDSVFEVLLSTEKVNELRDISDLIKILPKQ